MGIMKEVKIRKKVKVLSYCYLTRTIIKLQRRNIHYERDSLEYRGSGQTEISFGSKYHELCGDEQYR